MKYKMKYKMKTVIKTMFFIVCFVGCNVADAQTVNLGVRGGLSIPNIIPMSDNVLSDGYSSRLAGVGGIFTELGINDMFSVRFGIEYTGQGGKRNGIQAMSSNQLITDMATRMGANITEETIAMLGTMATYIPPTFYADVKNTIKFDYLMIPVSLQVGRKIGNTPARIYVNAGPFVSFLMSGEQVSKGSSKLYSDADKSSTLWETVPTEVQSLITTGAPDLAYIFENGSEFGTSVITGEIRPVNFGVQANVGLSYQYRQRSSFFIEVGGNYGFIRIQKNKSNGDNHIGSANVVFGYSFKITAQ
jgi:hypothetical protein